MATELATAYVAIATSSNTIGSSVKGALGQAEGYAQTTGGRISSSLSSAFGSATKSIATGITGLVASVGGLALGGGFARALAIDNAQAKMKALSYDTATVTDVMSTALNSVKGTAFGLGAAATLSSQLLAAGVKPGNDLARALNATADMSAVANVSLENLTPVMGQLAGSSHLYTQDLLQLQARGLPVFSWLAKSMGITVDKVREMVSAGEISFAQLETAIEQNIGGAAKKMDSFAASSSNVKAALSRLGAIIAVPTLQILKHIFDAAIPAVDALATKLNPLVDTLVVRLTPAFEALNRGIKGLATGGLAGLAQFGPALAPLAGAIAAIGGGSLAGMLGPLGSILPTISGPIGALLGFIAAMIAQSPALREALGNAFAAIGQILQALAPAFLAVGGLVGELAGTLGNILAEGINAVLPVIVQLAQMLGPILTQVISGLTPFIAQIMGALGSLMPVIGQLLAALMPIIAQILPPLMAALTVIIGSLLPSFSMILQALAPIVSSLVTALAPILVVLGNLISAVLPLVIKLLMAILGPILALVAPLMSLLGPALTWVANLLTSLLVPAIDWLSGALTTVIGWITQAVQWLGSGGLGSAASGVGTSIMGVFQPLITWFQTYVMPAFQAVGDFFIALWNFLQPALQPLYVAWGLIFGALKLAFEVFWLGAKAVWDTVGAVLGTTISAAWQVISSVLSGVWQNLVAIFTGIWDQIVIIVQTVLQVITGLFRAGTAVLKGDWSGAWNAIAEVFNSVTAGLVATGRNIIDTLVGMFRGVQTAIMGAFTGVTGWLIGVGEDILRGLIQGISNMGGAVLRAITGVVTGAIEGAKKLLGIASPSKVFRNEVGQMMGEGAALGIEDKRKRLLGATQSVFGSLAGSASFGTSSFGQAYDASLTRAGYTGGMPTEITLRDKDGSFIARMQTEAKNAIDDTWSDGSAIARTVGASR